MYETLQITGYLRAVRQMQPATVVFQAQQSHHGRFSSVSVSNFKTFICVFKVEGNFINSFLRLQISCTNSWQRIHVIGVGFTSSIINQRDR